MKTLSAMLCILFCLGATAQKNKNNGMAVKDSIGKIKEIRNPFDSNKVKQGTAGTPSKGQPKKANNNSQGQPVAAGVKQQNGYANQEVSYAKSGGSEPEKVATKNPEKPGEIKTFPKDKPEPVKAKEQEDNSPQRLSRSVSYVDVNSDVVIQLQPDERGWYKNIQLVCTGGGAIKFEKAVILVEGGGTKTININQSIAEGQVTSVFATGLINEELLAGENTKKTTFKVEKAISVTITIRNSASTTGNKAGVGFYMWK